MLAMRSSWILQLGWGQDMPINAGNLIRSTQAFAEDLSADMLRHAISYILVSRHFEYLDDALPYLLLQPKLADFEVPGLAQTSSSGNAGGRARVILQINVRLDTEIAQRRLQPEAYGGSLYHAIMLCLARRPGHRCLSTTQLSLFASYPRAAVPPLVDILVAQHPA